MFTDEFPDQPMVSTTSIFSSFILLSLQFIVLLNFVLLYAKKYKEFISINSDK